MSEEERICSYLEPLYLDAPPCKPPQEPSDFCELMLAHTAKLGKEFEELAGRTATGGLAQALGKTNSLDLGFKLGQAEEQLYFLKEEVLRLECRAVLDSVVARVQQGRQEELEAELRRQQGLREARQEHLNTKQSASSQSSMHQNSFSSSVNEDEDRRKSSIHREIRTVMAVRSINHRRIRDWESHFLARTGKPAQEDDRE
jgi:hypothetical protein